MVAILAYNFTVTGLNSASAVQVHSSIGIYEKNYIMELLRRTPDSPIAQIFKFDGFPNSQKTYVTFANNPSIFLY